MQNKRLKLQKYQLAIQTSLNNARFLSTTLQHCNESSLMSLLTTPDLSTAYSSDQMTDHQTCPRGCSPAAAASHSVQLSPTQCLGRYQESKAGCSLGCFSRYSTSSNNFVQEEKKAKLQECQTHQKAASRSSSNSGPRLIVRKS